MTKLQLQNPVWTSTSKSWPNLETLSSKSEQKLNFMTKLHLPNCTKLLSTRFSSSTSTKVTTSTSFKLPSAHARVTSIKFTKRQLVSESVSQWVSDKHSQWSDSGPTKIQMQLQKNKYTRWSRKCRDPTTSSINPFSPSSSSSRVFLLQRIQVHWYLWSIRK